MGSRVVVPTTVKLDISQGDWLLVKQQLNAGESRAQFARILQAASPGEKPRLDTTQVGISRVLAYLLDWSLVDPTGKRIEIAGKSEAAVLAALNSLDTDSFSEILRAVTAHEEAMDEAREKEKNDPDGETKSLAISPSAA